MLGAEFMHVLLNPETYSFRVDTEIDELDLKEVSDDGALGNWDAFFLDFYDVSDTGGYYISEWTCGEIDLDADGESELGHWTLFEITSGLSLKRGVNCISMITANNSIVGGGNYGTMAATAPVIDYLSIETTAQLGVFNSQDLGQGTNALHF